MTSHPTSITATSTPQMVPSLDHTSLFHNLIKSGVSNASSSSTTTTDSLSGTPHQRHVIRSKPIGYRKTQQQHINASHQKPETSPFITSANLLLKEIQSIEKSWQESTNSSSNTTESATPSTKKLLPVLHSQLSQLSKYTSFSQSQTQTLFYEAIIKVLYAYLHKRALKWQQREEWAASRRSKSSSTRHSSDLYSTSSSKPLPNRQNNHLDSQFIGSLQSEWNEQEESTEQTSNIDEQLKQQMIHESQYIQTDLLDETQDIMNSAMELSELNTIFAQKAKEQHEQIETMHRNVESGISNVEKARKILTDTDRKQQGAYCSRFWVAYVFGICALLLLVMDFVHA